MEKLVPAYWPRGLKFKALHQNNAGIIDRFISRPITTTTINEVFCKMFSLDIYELLKEVN